MPKSALRRTRQRRTAVSNSLVVNGFRSAMLCAAGNDGSSLLIILSINAFRSASGFVHVLARAAAGGALDPECAPAPTRRTEGNRSIQVGTQDRSIGSRRAIAPPTV